MKKKTIFIIVGILIVIAIAAYLYFKNKSAAAIQPSDGSDKTVTSAGSTVAANPLAPVVPFSAQSFLNGSWVFSYNYQGASGTEKATIANNVYSIDGVPTYNLQNVAYNQATNTLTLTKSRISNGETLPPETLIVDTVNNKMNGTQGTATNVNYIKS